MPINRKYVLPTKDIIALRLNLKVIIYISRASMLAQALAIVHAQLELVKHYRDSAGGEG